MVDTAQYFDCAQFRRVDKTSFCFAHHFGLISLNQNRKNPTAAGRPGAPS